MAGKDERLRAGAAFGKAEVDEKLVGAHLRHQGTRAVRVETVSSWDSARASLPGAYQR